jgi:hypothetical protein
MNFQKKCEICQKFSLYEVEEQNDLIVINNLVHISEPLTVFHPSKRKSVDDAKPSSAKIQSKIRHNNHTRILKCHFSIKNKSYIIVM